MLYVLVSRLGGNNKKNTRGPKVNELFLFGLAAERFITNTGTVSVDLYTDNTPNRKDVINDADNDSCFRPSVCTVDLAAWLRLKCWQGQCPNKVLQYPQHDIYPDNNSTCDVIKCYASDGF